MPRPRTILKWTVIGAVALLAVIQLGPYGRDHTNPPARRIAWDSPRTERLMTETCMDCHSNQTRWPWYSNVAPISWLVQRDVEEGRSEMNLSTGGGDVNRMIEAINGGEMPPLQYKISHAGSRLSDTEKQQLISGLRATFGP